MVSPTLILSSSSPRRRDILLSMGLEFSVRSVDVDERPLDAEPASDMVLRLAVAKATVEAVRQDEIVIAADTAVVLDEATYGKPRDEGDALQMLAALSGRTHQVMSGLAVATASGVQTALSVTDVRFRDVDPDEARRYWQSDEPRDKAGAYAIQGRGAAFVEAIMGSYTGVVGLPAFETARLLREAGLDTLPDE